MSSMDESHESTWTVWDQGQALGTITKEADGTWTATGLDGVRVYRCPTQKVATNLVLKAAKGAQV